jgi:hypothetical protein
MSSKKDGSGGPPSLATAPAQETGLTVAPPDSVIALRVLGSDAPDIPLPLTRRTFVLGSDNADPDVTVKVSSRMKDPKAREEVSRVHLLMQRKGKELLIRDQASTNGTYIKDAPVAEGTVKPGDRIRLGKGAGAVTLLAMDEETALLRPRLQWVLGFTAHVVVDEALTTIIRGDPLLPLLLVGEAACEQRWLAEQIHATSSRRFKGFSAIVPPLTDYTTPLAVATQGTVFIDLATFDKVPAPFVRELFGATYSVRPIIAAPDFDRASAQLGKDRALALDIIKIPPIRDRREDVPRILNSLFRRPPLEKKRDVAELGDAAVAALMEFDWPDNFDDLRRNAPRILALIESGGNKRGAARLLDQSHQNLNKALARIGL